MYYRGIESFLLEKNMSNDNVQGLTFVRTYLKVAAYMYYLDICIQGWSRSMAWGGPGPPNIG